MSLKNKIEWTTVTCGWCSKTFKLLPSTHRTRLKNARGGKLYCSLNCAGDARVKRERRENGKEEESI
jgi:hypothetical protein